MFCDQCIRVRSAVNKCVIDEVAAKAKAVFAEFGARNQEIPKGVPFLADYLIANMTMLESDASNLSYPIIRAIRFSPLWNIITEYLRTRSVYCLIPISTVRMVTPERRDTAIPFHQDGFGLPDEPDCNMVSVWVLLSPETCGPKTAPGLELLAGPVGQNLELETNPESPKFRHAQADNRQVAAIEAFGAKALNAEDRNRRCHDVHAIQPSSNVD
jgi:hypothetical protein